MQVTMTFTRTEQEWGQLMAVIANAPWSVANPWLMEIGEQLRNKSAILHPRPNGPEKEVSHAE